MRLTILLAVFFFTVNYSISQVVVTPYVVMIDSKNKFGTYSVMNMTDEEQEVSISFKYGHPVSDSEGNTTMFYDENPSSESQSLIQYIRVFPTRFVLEPGAKQTVRMTVSTPDDLKTGTYWTRIVTTSQRKQEFDENVTNLSTRINFVLNQITTVLYKNGHYKSSIELSDLDYKIDSTSLNLIADLKSTEDQPFFAKITYKVFDTGENLVTEGLEYASIYFDMKKKFEIPLSSLSPGNYQVIVNVSSDDTPDIPKSDNYGITPVEKSISVSIP